MQTYIFPSVVFKHFESCDDEVYTSVTHIDDGIISEVEQNNDAEEDVEDDSEEELNITIVLNPSISEVKSTANILIFLLLLLLFVCWKCGPEIFGFFINFDMKIYEFCLNSNYIQ